MISDILSIILKYIDDKTIKKLLKNTDNICIKKEYYDRFHVNYSKIKEDHEIIKKIYIDTNVFNLDIFPKLTHLQFGDNFNQAIKKGVFPNSLKDLVFGYEFNQPIGKNILPNSLEILKFGDYFNQPIGEGVLPNSLEHLEIGWNFNQLIEKGFLPNSLIYLKIGNNIIIDIKQ